MYRGNPDPILPDAPDAAYDVPPVRCLFQLWAIILLAALLVAVVLGVAIALTLLVRHVA